MADTNLNLNEITILGNILLDATGKAMLNAVERLRVEEFSDPRNQKIYQAMLEINEKNQVPDTALVTETLKNDKAFDQIGGEAYLDEIIEKTAKIASIEVYIDNIKDTALLNKFLNQCQDIVNSAQTQPISNISEFIGKSAERINIISQQRSIKDAKSLRDISPDLVSKWTETSKMFREKGIPADGVTGVTTGYPELDKLTKGWNPGQLIIIGARPAVGKTAFTLNLLFNAAKSGVPVLFFSLEMKNTSIETRLLEMASDLTSDEINHLDFAPDSTPEHIKIYSKSNADTAVAEKLQSGLNALATLPFYVDENPGTTIMDISTKCRKLMQAQKLNAGLIAIDYLGLIEASKKTGSDTRTNQVAEISRGLKKLANELNVPIIALSQLSRDSAKRGSDHVPILTDLRDSGALEQDADKVFFLYRPDYFGDSNKEGEDSGANQTQQQNDDSPFSPVDFILAKNRDGELKTIKFIFDKPHCRFDIRDDTFDQQYAFSDGE